ncbi:hypothetical protein IO99_09200 [Clostridium sulfidigenes]|uniref:Uncharacterized protein n=1 Tax=Clostridium sulfidigenes TaxID=318464 RepID=A0A084JC56_9CLOT|nr:hypothetical protein [Clostridium sulfidigenes]KEZ86540.1 hypothetical protein IO99_09200 [Clostridium sulfidigenes]
MGNKDLFIELKYKADGQGLEGINFLEDDKEICGQKYMLCGGVLNKNGGKLLFKARNIQEANEFTKRNPLTSKIVVCS